MLILAQFINLATTSFEKQEQTFDRVLIFLLQACTTFAENRALQLFLCKLCDCDCANPTDPSNHIVANHQQVAFGEIAKLGKKRRF